MGTDGPTDGGVDDATDESRERRDTITATCPVCGQPLRPIHGEKFGVPLHAKCDGQPPQRCFPGGG